MKITNRTTRTERTERIEIEGGELRPLEFSQDSKQYRVDSVVIKWDDVTGEWRPSWVTAYGPVLKKDGTDSRNRTTERFYTNMPRPEWLAELIADTDPSGGAS